MAEKNWKILGFLLPAGWRQMAWQSGAVRRLRGFPSPEVFLRVLMLDVARGYSLRETVVRARLANWTDISDVALLKRLPRATTIGVVRHRVASIGHESSKTGDGQILRSGQYNSLSA